MKRKLGIVALILAVAMLLTTMPFAAFADNAAVTNVTYTEQDGKLIFTVTTGEGYNRVKVSTADNPTGSLAVGSTATQQTDGTYTWTVKLEAPKDETVYVFDARTDSNNKYTRTYYSFTYTPAQAAEAITAVSYTVDSGKIFFTVTSSGNSFDRVMLSLASNPSKAVTTSYSRTENADGTTTFLVKIADPAAAADYCFDGRDASTGKYVKNYFAFSYVPAADASPIKNVIQTISGGKVFFTVTVLEGFNRVKVSSPDNPKGSLAVSSSVTSNGDGTETYTIKMAEMSAETTLLFDARDAATGKYLKEYFEYVFMPASVKIYSVSVSEEAGRIIFTVVTAPGYDRAKLALASDPTKSVAASYSRTENADGTLTFLLKVTEPGQKTEYVFDLRSIATGIFEKDYYPYTYEPAVPETYFVSVDGEISNGYAIFTVETTSAFNRVKISTLDNISGYIKYLNDYTELSNGNRRWLFRIEAPTEATTYYFDGRLDSNGKYTKDYVEFNLTPPAEPESTIRYVESAVEDGKLTFMVITSNKFNRVKVSLPGDTGYIAYTNKFQPLSDGSRQWMLVIDAPAATTEYVFDARLISTNRYSGDAYSYVYENPIPPECVENAYVTVGSVYISVIAITNEYCDRVTVSGEINGELTTYEISSYTLNTEGKRVFTVTMPAPESQTVFSVKGYNGTSWLVIGEAEVTFYNGLGDGIDHEVL